MISETLSTYGLIAGAAVFVIGVAWRGLSEHTVRHHYAGGFIRERVYSVWADVAMASGVVIFLLAWLL